MEEEISKSVEKKEVLNQAFRGLIYLQQVSYSGYIEGLSIYGTKVQIFIGFLNLPMRAGGGDWWRGTVQTKVY